MELVLYESFMSKIDRLNVAIFGAGSIGCYLGGQLAQGGAYVTFIGRDRFAKDVRKNGLTLTHFQRPDVVAPENWFDFLTDPGGIKDADIVLVCVKSQDSQAAAQEILEYAKPGALIISFQNGVSNPEVLSSALTDHTVLGGVVPFNVTAAGPGRFHCGTEGDLLVQADTDERLAALQGAFAQSGQEMKAVPDITAVQWGKLLVNLNNALNALTGGTLHAGLSQRSYRRALAMMIEEGLSVLGGANIVPAQFGKASIQQTLKILKMPNFAFKIIMSLVLKIDRKARSSMLDDLELGRGSEVQYLQGEIVNLAIKTGQTAPINQAVMTKVLKAFENGQSPKMTGDAILRLCQRAFA